MPSVVINTNMKERPWEVTKPKVVSHILSPLVNFNPSRKTCPRAKGCCVQGSFDSTRQEGLEMVDIDNDQHHRCLCGNTKAKRGAEGLLCC